MIAGARRSVPGLLLLVAVAGAATLLGRAIPLVTPLVLAIAVGAVAANVFRIPAWAERGVATHSTLLEAGIILLGASLSVEAIVAAGPVLVGLIVAVVAFGLALVQALSRAAALGDRMGSLLAAGSSICGVSAIAAVAPVCDADESQIAHAAATILLFDAVTLVAFPAVGSLLDVAPRPFGVWIGLSMFSTGPVAAAGFAHSPVAGKWATMTKLARNALIGVVAVGYSIRYTGRTAGAIDQPVRQVWVDFPKFLLGFVLVALLTNVGAIPGWAVDPILTASDALFLLAFAGLGFEIRLGELRNAGVVPVGVVGGYLLVVSALTYLLVGALF
ncbi:putative sulfate exporter family transporter [Halostella sp. JP-L12]|uniref:YeiH family protein n=1 Tax=Halostella TaxID=1843185 RepID=UPI000EF8251A|nr:MULTISPECIES: putative sulfate exporter family transporter [Halostella]NHN49148.1 putative sulfate exporter family transporter [Halostella sp. JP-L12]